MSNQDLWVGKVMNFISAASFWCQKSYKDLPMNADVNKFYPFFFLKSHFDKTNSVRCITS